jgi:hypothetical protein
MDTRQRINRSGGRSEQARSHNILHSTRKRAHQAGQPNHNDSASFLIGVRSARSALPPVGESGVIGNHVPARDDYLQCVVGSKLLVNRDRMIPDWRWLVWRMGFSGEERLRAVVEVPADRPCWGVFERERFYDCRPDLSKAYSRGGG